MVRTYDRRYHSRRCGERREPPIIFTDKKGGDYGHRKKSNNRRVGVPTRRANRVGRNY